MKKLNVLLVLLLAIAGTAWAQQADIYAVGSSTHSSGKQCAVVYHNTQKLYEIVPPLGDYNNESSKRWMLWPPGLLKYTVPFL